MKRKRDSTLREVNQVRSRNLHVLNTPRNALTFENRVNHLAPDIQILYYNLKYFQSADQLWIAKRRRCNSTNQKFENFKSFEEYKKHVTEPTELLQLNDLSAYLGLSSNMDMEGSVPKSVYNAFLVTYGFKKRRFCELLLDSVAHLPACLIPMTVKYFEKRPGAKFSAILRCCEQFMDRKKLEYTESKFPIEYVLVLSEEDIKTVYNNQPVESVEPLALEEPVPLIDNHEPPIEEEEVDADDDDNEEEVLSDDSDHGPPLKRMKSEDLSLSKDGEEGEPPIPSAPSSPDDQKNKNSTETKADLVPHDYEFKSISSPMKLENSTERKTAGEEDSNASFSSCSVSSTRSPTPSASDVKNSNDMQGLELKMIECLSEESPEKRYGGDPEVGQKSSEISAMELKDEIADIRARSPLTASIVFDDPQPSPNPVFPLSENENEMADLILGNTPMEIDDVTIKEEIDFGRSSSKTEEDQGIPKTRESSFDKKNEDSSEIQSSNIEEQNETSVSQQKLQEDSAHHSADDHVQEETETSLDVNLESQEPISTSAATELIHVPLIVEEKIMKEVILAESNTDSSEIKKTLLPEQNETSVSQQNLLEDSAQYSADDHEQEGTGTSLSTSAATELIHVPLIVEEKIMREPIPEESNTYSSEIKDTAPPEQNEISDSQQKLLEDSAQHSAEDHMHEETETSLDVNLESQEPISTSAATELIHVPLIVEEKMMREPILEESNTDSSEIKKAVLQEQNEISDLQPKLLGDSAQFSANDNVQDEAETSPYDNQVSQEPVSASVASGLIHVPHIVDMQIRREPILEESNTDSSEIKKAVLQEQNEISVSQQKLLEDSARYSADDHVQEEIETSIDFHLESQEPILASATTELIHVPLIVNEKIMREAILEENNADVQYSANENVQDEAETSPYDHLESQEPISAIVASRLIHVPPIVEKQIRREPILEKSNTDSSEIKETVPPKQNERCCDHRNSIATQIEDVGISPVDCPDEEDQNAAELNTAASDVARSSVTADVPDPILLAEDINDQSTHFDIQRLSESLRQQIQQQSSNSHQTFGVYGLGATNLALSQPNRGLNSMTWSVHNQFNEQPYYRQQQQLNFAVNSLLSGGHRLTSSTHQLTESPDVVSTFTISPNSAFTSRVVPNRIQPSLQFGNAPSLVPSVYFGRNENTLHRQPNLFPLNHIEAVFSPTDIPLVNGYVSDLKSDDNHT